MASTPSFASTPVYGAALLGSRDTTALPTALTAPSNVGTIVTAGSGGTKIEEVEIVAANTTVAGVLNLYVYESGGTTYRLFDQILISAVTASNTAVAFRAVRQYTNLVLPGSTYSLRANHNANAATNDSILIVSAFGASL